MPHPAATQHRLSFRCAVASYSPRSAKGGFEDGRVHPVSRRRSRRCTLLSGVRRACRDHGAGRGAQARDGALRGPRRLDGARRLRRIPSARALLLDRFYDAMAVEIERAGGTVEKFVGDAVMAGLRRAGGARGPRRARAARGARDAASARRGVRRSARAPDRRQHRRGGRRPAARGQLVRRPATPSTSSARLEQAAAPGEILVGERTVTAVRGAFEFGEPTTVEAKGKPDGVACRRLLRALSLMRPRGVRRAATAPSSGRESRARAAAGGVSHDGRARTREPHLVTILGDAGVGQDTARA